MDSWECRSEETICDLKLKEKIGLIVDKPNCDIGFNALVTIELL